MELLKLLFEVRFRRDFGIIWCAHVLFTASQNMNLVFHYRGAPIGVLLKVLYD